MRWIWHMIKQKKKYKIEKICHCIIYELRLHHALNMAWYNNKSGRSKQNTQITW